MEYLLIILAIPVINWLVQLGKKHLNLSGKIILVLVSIWVWALYTLFQRIAPATLQATVVEFVWQAGFASVLIYEFIIKKVLDNE